MISFEQAKYTEPDAPNEGSVNMIPALNWIVNHRDGDLVFLANRDVPAMLRRDGHIWLDRKDCFWIAEDLKRLTFSCERKTLPRY